MVKICTLFSLMLFAVCVVNAQGNFDSVRIEPVKIKDNIYMLKGSGGNIGVLTGTDGVLMIDDQFAPLSEKIKNAVNDLHSGDIRFLINTHVHGDHTGGNENFKKMGATIVAHDLVLDRMTKEEVNGNRTNPPRDKDAWPVITFSKSVNFHFDGEDIEVIHLSNAHTDGDAVIHFKQSNVYHTGDVFVRYGYPFIDISRGGSIDGFIAALDDLLGMMDDQSKVIPGHGEPGTKQDVKIFRDKIKDMRDQVVEALKKGKKTEDIASLPIATKYDSEWGGGFVKGKDFALMIAENYTKTAAKK